MTSNDQLEAMRLLTQRIGEYQVTMKGFRNESIVFTNGKQNTIQHCPIFAYEIKHKLIRQSVVHFIPH